MEEVTDESERQLELSRLFELAVRLFEGNATEARNWFETPNIALADRSPLSTAATAFGAREVEALIGRLQHGVFG